MKLFAPLIAAHSPYGTRRGVGIPIEHHNQDDINLIGADWWYDWGCVVDHLSDPRYIPMSYDGTQQVNLPRTYDGYLLVLNEPENWMGMTPETGARLTLKLADWYHSAKLIVGGCGTFEARWLYDFVTLLGNYRPAGWHVHGYIERTSWATVTINDVTRYLDWARDVTKTGEFWVTEFADCDDGTQAKTLLDYVTGADYVTRYAWFASRLTGRETYYPPNWTVNPSLIDADGKLTPIGEMYR